MTTLGFKSTVKYNQPIVTSGKKVILAALDLGTNNCRLSIARVRRNGFSVFDGFSRIVRLGEGLVQTGSLSRSAMERTLAALRVCAAKLERYRPDAMRLVATQACRQAANGFEFLHRVHEETGLPIEAISAEEEIFLTLAGCADLLEYDIPHALIFDIGGGSTEIVWLDLLSFGSKRVRAWVSIPLGVVTLSESYATTPDGYLAIRAEIMTHLQAFEAQHALRAAIEAEQVQMLGTSGTVTTLVGIHLKLARYDRSHIDGCFLNFDDLIEALRHVVALDHDDRVAHPCIGLARADLVVAGCAILESICQVWPVGRLRIADRGVREGILLELLGASVPVFRPPSTTGAIRT